MSGYSKTMQRTKASLLAALPDLRGKENIPDTVIDNVIFKVKSAKCADETMIRIYFQGTDPNGNGTFWDNFELQIMEHDK